MASEYLNRVFKTVMGNGETETAPGAPGPLAEKVSRTPEPGDVAVHPQSPSYHEPGALVDSRIRYLPEGVARATFGLEPCPHCAADGVEVQEL